MLTVAVEAWIGNAAAVLSGVWGAVTRRAEQSGYSRTAIYQHAERVVEAVANEQAGDLSYDDLWAENQWLRAENQELWQALEASQGLPQSKQRELASTAFAMGLSLTPIMTLLAVVLSGLGVPSRATVGRWVQHSCEQAGRVLAVLDEACRARVVTLCLDEIFFHQTPVLAMVEPHSMVWVGGQRGPDRKGETWFALLEPWTSLERVVSDAGTGLEKGVRLLNEARAETTQGEGAPVSVGLDTFHTLYEFHKVLARYWRRAESLLEMADQADHEVAKVKRRGRDARGVSARARAAWRRAEQAFDQAVSVEAACDQIRTALGLFRPDGALNNRREAQRQIDEALVILCGSEWDKARRLLQDPRTLSHLDQLREQLQEIVVEPPLCEALCRLWYWRSQRRRLPDLRQARVAALAALQEQLCQRLSEDWEQAYAQVAQLITHTERASSAVECMNSVLRMHQNRHRYVSQAMLDLKRLFWNCRRFSHGKRRKACPYELLGLNLPTYNWWKLLQMDPEELRQQLSTQEVTV
jgi:tetratricopeptide (TPR) repeat protein